MNFNMRYVLSCLVAMLFLVTTGLAVSFIRSEQNRSKIIESYLPPENIFKSLTDNKDVPINNVFMQDEILACAFNSYGRPEDLKKLNSNQSMSISKSSLPSEDMAWYLIFFNKNSATRIYLINTSGPLVELDSGPECYDLAYSIRSTRKKTGSDEEYYSVIFANKKD